MAAPTLTLLNYTSINTCEDVTNWTDFDTLDTDIKKEGSNGITGTFRADLEEGYYTHGSALTAASKHLRLWVVTTSVPYMEPESGGGYELLMYDGSSTEYKTIFGSDTYFGGWFNMIYDCEEFTTLTLANVTRWGIRVNHTTNGKNVDNMWMDAVKYLDGYSMTGGTSGDEITLATIEEADRGTTTLYGYGVLTTYQGVYYCTGEIQFGTGATTMWFKMDGDILIFEDQPVATGLYKLSGVGTGSRVTIQNSVIQSSGTTAATRFDLDWSDADLLSLTMTDNLIVRADTTVFKSGQTATGNTYDDCGQITHGGADMSESTIKNYEGTANTSALIYNVNADPDGELDDCSFAKGTAATHAVEFGLLSPLTMTIRGCDFDSYNASDTQNDSTFHFKRTSGTVTLNLIDCTGNASYRTDGATVNIVASVALKVTVTNQEGDLLEAINVRYEESDGTLISNGSTNASGIFTFSEDQANLPYADAKIVIRNKAFDDYSQTLTIPVTGFDIPVTLQPDPAVNLP